MKNEGDDLDSDDSSEESSLGKERHSSGESNDSAVSLDSVPTSPTKLTQDESPSTRFLVMPATPGNLCKTMKKLNLRGILKRPRCFSDSGVPDFLRMMSSPAEACITEEETGSEKPETGSCKTKSVRFNEVVQRQVYRSNSSILGQKLKNLKKAEQKRRKAARRASEGDLPSTPSSFNEDSEAEHTNDSGVASSMDDETAKVSGSKFPEPEVANRNRKLQKEAMKKIRNSKVASRFDNDELFHNSDLIFNLDFWWKKSLCILKSFSSKKKVRFVLFNFSHPRVQFYFLHIQQILFFHKN